MLLIDVIISTLAKFGLPLGQVFSVAAGLVQRFSRIENGGSASCSFFTDYTVTVSGAGRRPLR